MTPHKTYFNWSSGKDSALALHHLLQDRRYNVELLLTSVNVVHDRVSMHGLRRELLVQQTAVTGIASTCLELPESPTNEEYEQVMKQKAAALKSLGFEYAAFGDIYLEDLRKYREQQLQQLDIKTVFPIWKKDPTEIMHELIDLGFKAVVICVNAAVLDGSFAGRMIDRDFMADLPPNVDPCGENGEFHTFCFDAPFFKQPVQFEPGETVFREYVNGTVKSGFWFQDLLPLKENA